MSSYYDQTLELIQNSIFNIVPEIISGNWHIQIAGPAHTSPDPSYFSRIIEPARDLILRGGKRWRPVLMVFCCRMCGGRDAAVPISPIVELAHNGSLIVDDIEDRSHLRRGQPAIHKLYGEDTGINSGNLLYFLPLHILKTINLPDSVRLSLFDAYFENMLRLHMGQGLDIQWHRDIHLYPNTGDYMQMCRYKTGSLSRFAGQAGAIMADTPEKTDLLGNLMEDLGLAFQIIDDVINLSKGNPGKEQGDDIIEGKKSLPVCLFAEQAGKQELQTLSELMASAKEKGFSEAKSDVNKAVELLDKSGCIKQALQMASKIIDRLINDLKNNFPNTRDRDEIISLIYRLRKAAY